MCMNVKELKDLIKDIDDDVEVVSSVMIEQGRGCSGGLTYHPGVCHYEVNEFERSINEDYEIEDSGEWIYDDDEGLYKNTKPLLVLEGDVEEQWYQ